MGDSYNDFILREGFNIFCGREIGFGIGRKVHLHRTDPTLVIKVEEHSRSFQNVVEYETWQALMHTPFAKWLAPVIEISASGTVLIMKRTTPCPDKKLPTRMPAWLSDYKSENYGMLDGKFVCHDYGTNLLLNHGAFRNKMKAVDWGLGRTKR